ncbi:hypothetical protein M3Y98_00317000 [Aphelenchoides besseyi]|nr:hypothetical protein M3Y98_00317000 [Aphelenchoides besseyi]
MDVYLQLQDHEGNVNRPVICSLGNKATHKQLQEEVKEVFNIDPKHQLIKVNDENLKIGALSAAGVQNGDTIFVKHSNVVQWERIIRSLNEIARTRDIEEQISTANILRDLIHLITEQKFFHRYGHLLGEKLRISSELREYLGGSKATREAGTKLYFFNWLKETGKMKDLRSFNVHFGPKVGGVHSGCTATIVFDGMDEKYYIKTHHDGSTGTSSIPYRAPNLREVFAYVLLEIIGLCPETHFYGPIPGEGRGTLFIATKSISELELMNTATPKSSNIKDVILQIHIASSILCLKDVHDENCGFSNNRAWIFDFAVPQGYYNMEMQLFKNHKPQCAEPNMRTPNKISAFAQTITANERMEFGKEIVETWNLLENVDKAVEKVTSVKEKIRSSGGIIERTDDFDTYIQGVKSNILLFTK